MNANLKEYKMNANLSDNIPYAHAQYHISTIIIHFIKLYMTVHQTMVNMNVLQYTEMLLVSSRSIQTPSNRMECSEISE